MTVTCMMLCVYIRVHTYHAHLNDVMRVHACKHITSCSSCNGITCEHDVMVTIRKEVKHMCTHTHVQSHNAHTLCST